MFFAELPDDVRELAEKVFALFLRDPDHPSLRRHALKDTKKGQHRKDSISISVSKQYRAIYVEDGDVNVWYWIGTHAAYNRYTGKT